MERKYVSFSKLSYFLDKIKNEFATKDELSKMSYKIIVVTQSEYDALVTKDENTIYVIEV